MTCPSCLNNTCPEAPEITINEYTLSLDGVIVRMYQQALSLVAGFANMYLLPAVPIAPANVLLLVNGQVQRYLTDFTINGAYLQAVAAFPADSVVWCHFLGTAAAAAAPTLQTGQIIDWPTATAPVGFLEADGSAISRDTYSALFAVIGTTFGAGDGTTTFNLPDPTAESGFIKIIKT